MSLIPVLNSLHACSLPGLLVEGARECLSLPYDLHLVCREGRLVRTHINLLTVISSLVARIVQQLPPTTGLKIVISDLLNVANHANWVCVKFQGLGKVFN